MATKLALQLRALTVPPVLVSAMLLLLYFFNNKVFESLEQLLVSLLLLVIIPFSAYPLSYAVPAVRKRGRGGQRTLALVCSLIGYAGALLYSFLFPVSPELFLIFITYFISVAILTFCTSVLKLKASGHACGTAGPLVFLVYFVGAAALVPCLVIAVAVVWSSLYLKRHTVMELVLGAAAAVCSLLITLAIFSFI